MREQYHSKGRLLSVNPATGETLRIVEGWDDIRLEAALNETARITSQWGETPVSERAALLRRVAEVLRAHNEQYARLITLEMGKLLREARTEIERCAAICEFYAGQGGIFLADNDVDVDGARAYVQFAPLGTVLGIMPWNFPFWQVFRFAAPALLAGNTCVLKHAPNVPQCALALEQIFKEAGLPSGVFQSLLITPSQSRAIIADHRIHAVALTGSEQAGRSVAQQAGAHLKKTVLELGGSDAFIVLDDADLSHTVTNAVQSRYQNAGQSCVAAKRFIVVEAVADAFVERLRTAVAELQPGDPLAPETRLAPMARFLLRDSLHQQVEASIQAGAVPLTGCQPVNRPGCYYAASILDRVQPGIPAFEEELFGPVAAIVRVRDEAEALRLANATRYGLGGSVWTADRERGEHLARRLQTGLGYVNSLVKSDLRLPFGGVKCSGYGRELSSFGIREFVNVRTVLVR